MTLLIMLALMSYHFWVMVAVVAALSLSYSIKESSIDDAIITEKFKKQADAKRSKAANP